MLLAHLLQLPLHLLESLFYLLELFGHVKSRRARRHSKLMPRCTRGIGRRFEILLRHFVLREVGVLKEFVACGSTLLLRGLWKRGRTFDARLLCCGVVELCCVWSVGRKKSFVEEEGGIRYLNNAEGRVSRGTPSQYKLACWCRDLTPPFDYSVVIGCGRRKKEW